MTISEIWIYPIKSLGGIRLTQAQVEERGLQYDRRWMIVDENGVFITQRVYPKMALLDVSIELSGLLIVNRKNPESRISVNFEPSEPDIISVKIFDDEVEAELVGDQKVDNWLSQYIGITVRLVKMPENGNRPADPRYARNGENVSFADGFPFLLISEASLEDLNERLASPITMRRFRPNFIINGMSPYQEDILKEIQIGDIGFSLVKPCGRCVMTTIDPITIEKSPEPLKTLASYRRLNNKILFGQNLTAKNHGEIKEGDHVIIIE